MPENTENKRKGRGKGRKTLLREAGIDLDNMSIEDLKGLVLGVMLDVLQNGTKRDKLQVANQIGKFLFPTKKEVEQTTKISIEDIIESEQDNED